MENAIELCGTDEQRKAIKLLQSNGFVVTIPLKTKLNHINYEFKHLLTDWHHEFSHDRDVSLSNILEDYQRLEGEIL